MKLILEKKNPTVWWNSYFQHSVVPSIHVHIHRGHSPAYWYSFHVPNRRWCPYSTECLQQKNINSTIRWGIYHSFFNSLMKYYSKEFRIVIHWLLNEGESKLIFILWLQKVLSITDFLTHGTSWPLPPLHTPTIKAAWSVDTCGPMLAGEVHTLICVYKRFPIHAL